METAELENSVGNAGAKKSPTNQFYSNEVKTTSLL